MSDTDEDDIKRDKKAKSERDLEIVQVQAIMNTESGRAFMWRVLGWSGLYSDIFDPDPCIHARYSGQRAQGIMLEHELKEAGHDNFLKMLKENKDG